MLTINELKYTDDKETIVIDCQVDEPTVFRPMVQVVYLEKYNNFSENTDYTSTYPPTAYGILNTTPHFQRTITARDMQMTDFSGSLIYVIIVYTGPDNTLTQEVVPLVDWQLLYQYGLGLLASYYKKCNQCAVPDVLEEFIILWHAIELAIDTCDWTMLNKLWDKFTLSGNVSSIPCGCNQNG